MFRVTLPIIAPLLMRSLIHAVIFHLRAENPTYASCKQCSGLYAHTVCRELTLAGVAQSLN